MQGFLLLINYHYDKVLGHYDTVKQIKYLHNNVYLDEASNLLRKSLRNTIIIILYNQKYLENIYFTDG